MIQTTDGDRFTKQPFQIITPNYNNHYKDNGMMEKCLQNMQKIINLENFPDDFLFWFAPYGLKLLDLVSYKEANNDYSCLYENR